MPSTTADPVSKPAAERPGWLSWSIAVLFGLFFAYDVFEAVGNLVGIVGTANGLAVPVLPLGWVVLIGGLLLPVVAFAIAFLDRSRAVARRAGRALPRRPVRRRGDLAVGPRDVRRAAADRPLRLTRPPHRHTTNRPVRLR